MQLGGGIASAGEQVFRSLQGRAACAHDLVEGFAPHEFHNDGRLLAHLVAIDDARQVHETRPRPLSLHHAPPCRADTVRCTVDLAHERAEPASVGTGEVDALGTFEPAILQNGIDEIAIVSLQGVQISLQIISHKPMVAEHRTSMRRRGE